MSTPPASFKTMILDKTIKRADAMKIEYSRIHVVPDFNLRELDDQYEAEIQDLLAHILAGGLLPPLEVVAMADGSGVELVDGHRRYDAMGRAIAQGFPINWVSIVAFQGNKIDRMARVYTSNKNSQLRPLEAARGFKRFRGAGLDSAEIAAIVHFSRTHVENYLVLADAERDVQELVRSCQVAADVAIEAVRKLGAKAGEFLFGKVGQAKAAGKTKVTASTIHGRALPRKVVTPLISGVDAFIKGLDANQRATLVDIQEGRVAADTITVKAEDLFNLFQAHGAVEAVRAKRAEKAAKEAQQAASDTQAPMNLEQEEATA
ncbi:ParB/RepB/Spo0J family partition protein [Achromobacter marplatensis]|uniref:ParB/RepB/Spo0J family partition protein n=1 Tax=Achromobacter marplatensis TaxID=470868 RepID=A0AA43B481_9BURK|nr:ParB/RepB/Spo0J family partition protein [Achromobacter marplatensis]MDH2053374.1 ParB/RepB/Spo0J family partition protein [Achromobacter marplatensis]